MTVPKDNTPDELDKILKPLCGSAILSDLDSIDLPKDYDEAKQKLRDYIAREIDAVIGRNDPISATEAAWGLSGSSENVLRKKQRRVAAGRGWRIG